MQIDRGVKDAAPYKVNDKSQFIMLQNVILSRKEA